MKKFFYLLCCVSLLCSSCNRTSECQKVIEKLQLNENGFCDIELGYDAFLVADRLGDANPANYSHMCSSCQLKKQKKINGINVLVIASFSSFFLDSANYAYGSYYTFSPISTTELSIAIPCDKNYNKSIAGKRLELYNTICEYYRLEFSPVFYDMDETSTFFRIRVPSKASSLITPNTVVVQQDEENNCVTILINDNEDSYDEWKSGEL